ncbi:hypothetical protein FQN60_018660 [Etheostoma spectabile]|uniref:V-SNARE coiled-coil homology domain-containing protein n=2 Tax=Etheostoma spectabile TaxID=54343 RepID=A0A5J5CB08_9PERO|nr:hypothetical protein FQN60_018660 [Etheostoma spectabile]
MDIDPVESLSAITMFGVRHGIQQERGGAAAEPQDKVKSLRDQVDGVKDIMTQNVDRILARGERLDDLMGKSEDLQAGAQHFKQTSQKVARTYWWKNVKMVVVIVVIVLIIVLIIILLATGEQGGVAAPRDKIQALRDQVDEVRDKMKENMEQVIERGEKGLDLLAKAEEMEKGAQHLTQTTRKVARTYWWKNVKMIVVVVVIVLIIVLIIILLATGVIPVSSSTPPVVLPTNKP